MLTRATSRSASIAGCAVAVAGIACLAFGLGAQPPAIDLMLSVLALLASAMLFALGSLDPAAGLYGGLISRLTTDPRRAWLLRAAIVLSAPFAGVGVVGYALAALYDALTGRKTGPALVDARTTAGTGMLGLAVVLAVRATHVGVGPRGIVLWALLLIASGLSLFWAAAAVWRSPEPESGDHTMTRTILGLLLASAGFVLVLTHTVTSRHVGSTVAATSTALAVLALVGGPWWLRTRRILADARTARARAQERAEMADHLHDSVLQTLALIQRQSADPARVAALARRQERELRDWLLGRSADELSSFSDALRALAAEVEDAHGAEFEIVIVGDTEAFNGPVHALLAATREALFNAAKHAPDAQVSLYSRVEPERISVYVHDRGPGFDLRAIPPDRHGVRESIVGRMLRVDGYAEIRTEPGSGCEVILTLERK